MNCFSEFWKRISNMATPTAAELLILRGIHLIVRASFSPNEPSAQAKHFKDLTNDIGPWFTDYARTMAETEAELEIEVQRMTGGRGPDIQDNAPPEGNLTNGQDKTD